MLFEVNPLCSVVLLIKRLILFIYCFFAFLSNTQISLFAQTKIQTNGPTESAKKPQILEILKPVNFQNMKLPAEKSSAKRYTALRAFYNNTTTRYNYIYNAQLFLEKIIDSAQEHYKENFTAIPITFLNYDPDYLAKTFFSALDSMVMRLTSGILLHDLRNKWVDDMYLYMGKMYYYKQDYDSALLMFQYVNYQYDSKYENRSYFTETGKKKLITAPTVVNREDKGFWAKLKHTEQARNEALVWIVKTHTELEEYDDAAALMSTLDKDIFFPQRLRPLYDEVKAYYYYKKKQYTIAAQHLINTIQRSKDRQEKGRRCYLIAQLYNLEQREDLATQYLKFSIQYTYDPVLEIYSRIYFALQERHPNVYIINDHIRDLLKLLNQERFELYADLIYYGASLMAIKKNDLVEATSYIQKSVAHIDLGNAPDKNFIYYQLFELLWKKKNYLQCAHVLDKIEDAFLNGDTAKQALLTLRNPLKEYVQFQLQKDKQDSLKKIAFLSKKDRESFVLKKAKAKESELKKNINTKKQEIAFEKFAQLKNNRSFENKDKQNNDIQQFNIIWGNRKNVDHWRRKAAIGLNDFSADNNGVVVKQEIDTIKRGYYKTLLEQIENEIPLTTEQQVASDEIISDALYQMANIAYLKFKDNYQAVEFYKDIVTLYPRSKAVEDAYANLYFLYKEIGVQQETINALKEKYVHQFAQGKFTNLFTNNLSNTTKPNEDKEYETIYDLYEQKKYSAINTAYQELTQHFPQSIYQHQAKLLLALAHTRLRQFDVAQNIIAEGIKHILQEKKSEATQKVYEAFKKLEGENKKASRF